MRFLKSLSGLFIVLASILVFFFTDCNSSNEKVEKVSNQPDFSNYEFKNHHPDANYIGMAECATCHVDKYLTFQHTGKGRSFHSPKRDKIIEDFNKLPVYDKYSNLYYDAFWIDSIMYIKEFRLSKKGDTIHNRVEEVKYVIGSGNQTRSYIREINEYLYEMPITWYVKKGIWDLSPGYENGLNSRFDRPIGDMCLNCHNSELNFTQNSSNHFTKVGSGIECEKCHGPGSFHKEAVLNEEDYKGTIINPTNLTTELRFDICRQCHLEGVVINKDGKTYANYKPGMKLNSIYDVFIPTHASDNDFGFASHAERLQMSACFKGMNGEMACTTCHDPHKSFDKNPVDYFNKQCSKCHGVDACGVEHTKMVEAENDCVKCHMARGGTHDIPHVSSTDHNIRILNNDENEVENHSEDELKIFKNFTSNKIDDRTEVLLHINYYEQFEGNKEYLKRVEDKAFSLTKEEKLKFHFLLDDFRNFNIDLKNYNYTEINDPYTCYYLFKAYERKGELKPEILEKAVALAPKNIDFLFNLASVYTKSDKQNAASLYEGILELNPLHAQTLVNYGFQMMQKQNLDKSEELLKKAVENYPDYTLAKENYVMICALREDYDNAKYYLDLLIEENPNDEKYKKLRSRLN